ncbi:MAG: signal peptidase II [Desulfatiglandaceae bacterium]
MKTRHHLMLWPALIIVVLDQITKLAVANRLQVFESVPVVTGFFNLVHVRNRGMAFGLMNRPDIGIASYFLLAASLIAVVLILVWFFKLKEEDNQLTLGLSLILAGAVGNLIDRVRLGEVIDFLDFHLGTYHWPAFNLADAAITVGTVSIALNLIFQRKTHA